MDMYFYLDKEGKQKGPVAPDTLKANGVTGDTLVWKAGMEQWAPAYTIKELDTFLRQPETPPAPPTAAAQASAAQASQLGYSKSYSGYAQSSAQSATHNEQPHSAAPSGSEQPKPKPDTYLIWAILCTICCCTPIGAYSIICSTQADTLYKRGDYDGAVKKANESKKWSIIGAVAGGIGSIFYAFSMAVNDML